MLRTASVFSKHFIHNRIEGRLTSFIDAIEHGLYVDVSWYVIADLQALLCGCFFKHGLSALDVPTRIDFLYFADEGGCDIVTVGCEMLWSEWKGAVRVVEIEDQAPRRNRFAVLSEVAHDVTDHSNDGMLVHCVR